MSQGVYDYPGRGVIQPGRAFPCALVDYVSADCASADCASADRISGHYTKEKRLGKSFRASWPRKLAQGLPLPFIELVLPQGEARGKRLPFGGLDDRQCYVANLPNILKNNR